MQDKFVDLTTIRFENTLKCQLDNVIVTKIALTLSYPTVFAIVDVKIHHRQTRTPAYLKRPKNPTPARIQKN